VARPLESVPNFSEGRDRATIDALAEALSARARLLDVHSDPDHNRSVYTLAGEPGRLSQALVAGAREAVASLDLTRHTGVHPRVGALDIVPVVHLDADTRGAACAEALVVADRLGDELASKALVVADDGRDPGGLASAPFDGEGTARGRTPLVSDGKLLAYLHDSYTGRRGGERSTGNASRSSYRSPPSVSPSNLILEPGDLTLEQLIANASDGVYITEVAGLHSGVNPVTGRYSVGATGRAIRGGELAEPLREFTIAGDLLGTLAAVRAVGSETRWVPFGGSVRTAPMLVGEMAIGGA
jgi:hypothetical protein